jgi:hypothetical protein
VGTGGPDGWVVSWESLMYRENGARKLHSPRTKTNRKSRNLKTFNTNSNLPSFLVSIRVSFQVVTFHESFSA